MLEEFVIENCKGLAGEDGMIVKDKRGTLCGIIHTPTIIAPGIDPADVYDEVAQSIEWLPKSPQWIRNDGESIRFAI